MVAPPSDQFVTLVATLFEALPEDGQSIQDDDLLQLHAVFGSMLVAALQLIDRREVVKVLLPNGRYIYQITSAIGSPYTLFAALPDRPPQPQKSLEPRGNSPTQGVEPMDTDSRPPTSSPSPVAVDDAAPPAADGSGVHSKQAVATRAYVVALKRCMEGMYCPCTGYGFNTLAGEKNIFCKHLLALILAHCMNRLVHTEVYLKDIVHLLGLASGPVPEPPQTSPKKDEAVRLVH